MDRRAHRHARGCVSPPDAPPPRRQGRGGSKITGQEIDTIVPQMPISLVDALDRVVAQLAAQSAELRRIASAVDLIARSS